MSGLQLRAGALRLALRPDLGAAITGLWFDGLPLLRSSDLPQALSSARQAGALVLAPYSNRIAAGRFAWDGQPQQLALAPGEPHALHGLAWQRPWTVTGHSAEAAQLELRHRPDADWPFGFTLRQHLSLRPDGLDLALQLDSDDARDQPAGLGWHPFFERRDGAHLRLAVQRRWSCGPDRLPLAPEPHAPLDADIAALDLDHVYDGWDGQAWIDDAQLSLRLHLRSDARRVVVYAPLGRPFFCVEPVSHIHNALNLDDPLAAGLVRLRPGARLTLDCHLDLHPLPP
ncbi:MAG: aldose 1-epimerase [Burkholderiaceae bacterium]|nr:aldose 1-epimerase [Burkholderiaceae bacterium]